MVSSCLDLFLCLLLYVIRLVGWLSIVVSLSPSLGSITCSGDAAQVAKNTWELFPYRQLLFAEVQLSVV